MLNAKQLSIIAILISFIFSSCSKDENVDNNYAKITFNIKGVESTIQSNSDPKQQVANAILKSQNFKTSIGNGQYLEIDITPSIKANMQASTIPNKVVEPIPVDTRYRIVVYDDQGRYVNHTDEVIGGTTTPSIILPAGIDYKFLIYTLLTKDLPEWKHSEYTLENFIIEINEENGEIKDFNYFVANSNKLTSGTNNINVILRQNFTKLSIVMKSTAGVIEDVSSVEIDKVYASAVVRPSETSVVFIGDPHTTYLPKFTNLGTSTINTPKKLLIVKDGDSHTLTFRNV